ncbi:MAG: NB-ARC domain-containing protein [Saprospiraceae bacterium]
MIKKEHIPVVIAAIIAGFCLFWIIFDYSHPAVVGFLTSLGTCIGFLVYEKSQKTEPKSEPVKTEPPEPIKVKPVKTQTTTQPIPKEKKQFGTIPNRPDYFIGRKTDMKKIRTDFEKKRGLILLMNGEGGIGKTTLASQYYHDYYDQYRNVIWLFNNETIPDTLIYLSSELGITFQQTATKAEQVNEILKKLGELEAPSLLIIDNANDFEDLDKNRKSLELDNFDVLVTTRVTKQWDNTTTHKIKPLTKAKARQLFKKYYPQHDKTENALLDKLFVTVNRNTLVIELLAKNLANLNTKHKTRYTLSDLLTDISDKLLQLGHSKPINTLYQSQTQQVNTETPENIIKAMYELSNLSEAEVALLGILSVLPAESLPFGILDDLLQQDDLDQILLQLHNKGWIEQEDKTDSIRISPVIQQIIREKSKNLDVICEPLIDRLNYKLKYQGGAGHLLNITYEAAAILARYGGSLVINLFTIGIVNSGLSVLAERVGNYYQATGTIQQALKYYQQITAINEQLLQQAPDNSGYKNSLAISYEKLGNIQRQLGNLEQALEYYQKYTDLFEKLHNDFPNNVEFKNILAISYQYLGITQSALGNLEQALEYYQKDAELAEELHNDFPNNVEVKNSLAISYQNLGFTQNQLGNLEQALEYYQQYNKLEEELHNSFSNNIEFKKN